MAKESTDKDELTLQTSKPALVFFYESLVNRDGMVHGDQVTHIDQQGIMHTLANKAKFADHSIHIRPDL